MKKIKKSWWVFFFFFFSLKPEDSLHDFPTVGARSFQAAILLTIHMEMEGSGGADSHITLICPWMRFSVCPDPEWLKTLPVRPVCQTQRTKWKASTFQESAQRNPAVSSRLPRGGVICMRPKTSKMFICVPSVLKSLHSSLSNHPSRCFCCVLSSVFWTCWNWIFYEGAFHKAKFQEAWPRIVVIWSLST